MQSNSTKRVDDMWSTSERLGAGWDLVHPSYQSFWSRAEEILRDALKVFEKYLVAAPADLPPLLRLREGEGYGKAGLREFLAFGYKEALSCIFPVFIFVMLGVTKLVTAPIIPRYDFLLIAYLSMQWWMYRRGLESKRELVTISVFHLLGISMEIFKVSHGSWEYPESAFSKVFGVPLYSGFMYASVASYICQAWRRFDLRIEKWPPLWVSGVLGGAIYGNFYTNRYINDMRLVIIPLVVLVFARTSVCFRTNGVVRQMPMLLSFAFISIFLWLAENIGTSLGAWRYPYQKGAWVVVRPHIISSWFLLCIVSVIIVVAVQRLSAQSHLLPSRLALNGSSAPSRSLK